MKNKGKKALLEKKVCGICGKAVDKWHNHHIQYFPTQITVPVCIPDHNWRHGLPRNFSGDRFKRQCIYCGELIFMAKFDGRWTPYKIDGSERHTCPNWGEHGLFKK